MTRLQPTPHIAGILLLADRDYPSPSYDERIVKPTRRRRGDQRA